MPNVNCLGGIRSVETHSQVLAVKLNITMLQLWMFLILRVKGLVRLTARFELLFSA